MFNLRLLALPPLFLLSACNDMVPSWLDSAGSYLPTVGERCENWQCFTEGGREQSRMIQQERQMREKQEQSGRPASGPGPGLPQPPSRASEDDGWF